MNPNHNNTFRKIGDVLARQVMPELHCAARFPLGVNFIGVAGFDDSDKADSFEHVVDLGLFSSPEEAICAASERIARGDIGTDDTLRFQPRFATIFDRERSLVLAGAIRAGIILWQQPVGSNAEARRVVADAGRLRGRAFAAEDRGERVSARELRFCAAMLEARLVDLDWRETAADLLRLPQAA